jgi:CofH/MqnC C-terminal region
MICRSLNHFSQKHANRFVPLPYQPENNDIPVTHPPTGFDALRTIAVSRIYLDNFDHITAYWVGMGLKLAQVALSYGADDLHGTIIEEHIFHMAGATSPQLQTEAEMVKAIRESRVIMKGLQPQRFSIGLPCSTFDCAIFGLHARGRNRLLPSCARCHIPIRVLSAANRIPPG